MRSRRSGQDAPDTRPVRAVSAPDPGRGDATSDGSGGGNGSGDPESSILQQQLDEVLAEREELQREVQELRQRLAGAEQEAAIAREPEQSPSPAAPPGTGREADPDVLAERDRLRAERDEAHQRLERVGETLQRIRRAFQQKERRLETYEARWQEAEQQRRALADRLEELEETLERERGQSRELRSALEEARREQPAGAAADPAAEQRVAELEAALEQARRESRELVQENEELQARTSELQQRIEEAERRAREAEEASRGGDDSADAQQLRELLQRSASQIQRYLLELEATKGLLARTTEDVNRRGASLDELDRSLEHLRAYLEEQSGEEDRHALVLLQEVQRAASGVRELVESHRRLGDTMHRTVDRLSEALAQSMPSGG